VSRAAELPRVPFLPTPTGETTMTTDAPNTTDDSALRGPVLDVYGRWNRAIQQIGETHPHALKLQGWPETQGANVVDARRRWPDIVLALCPGVDPIAKRWRSHQNRDRAVRELVEIADGCVALGVEHLVYDAEGHWECKQVADRAKLAQVATQAMQQVREKHPTLRLYLTSYGWPVRVEDVGGHGNFPWRGWCDGVVYVGQTYDRGHGKLIDGERIAVASYDAAIEHRMMAPDTRRLVEIQTHHNDTAELVTVGTSTDAT
jgi:hypothetical protein